MALSKKQIILISVISGVVLLLAVGAALFLSPGEGEASPVPTASPTPTPVPTQTPPPTATPAPPIQRLPLVPLWDTPRPSAEPLAEESPASRAPAEGAGPWVGVNEGKRQDILAVGLLEGRAAALLLVRTEGETVTVIGVPSDLSGPEGLPLSQMDLAGEGPAAQAESAAKAVERALGLRYGAYMGLDLRCLPALLEVMGLAPLADALNQPGPAGAQGALDLAAEALRYVSRASLLQYPAVRRAVGASFGSNLSVRELWQLLRAVKGAAALRCALLPTQVRQGRREPDGQTAWQLLQFFLGKQLTGADKSGIITPA